MVLFAKEFKEACLWTQTQPCLLSMASPAILGLEGEARMGRIDWAGCPCHSSTCRWLAVLGHAVARGTHVSLLFLSCNSSHPFSTPRLQASI